MLTMGGRGAAHIQSTRRVDPLRPLADGALLGLRAVEVGLAEEHAGQEQRGVDGGKLDARPRADARGHVEEMVEEPLVAGAALGLGALGRFVEEAQRGQDPRRGLGAGDVPPLDPDGIGGEAEADGRDARGRGARVAVRH